MCSLAALSSDVAAILLSGIAPFSIPRSRSMQSAKNRKSETLLTRYCVILEH